MATANEEHVATVRKHVNEHILLAILQTIYLLYLPYP